jgi:hypothetical protein
MMDDEIAVAGWAIAYRGDPEKPWGARGVFSHLYGISRSRTEAIEAYGRDWYERDKRRGYALAVHVLTATCDARLHEGGNDE